MVLTILFEILDKVSLAFEASGKLRWVVQLIEGALDSIAYA